MKTATRPSPLLTVPEAARLLGISESAAYRTIQASNALAGVPVVRLGLYQTAIRVPRARLLAALGITGEA